MLLCFFFFHLQKRLELNRVKLIEKSLKYYAAKEVRFGKYFKLTICGKKAWDSKQFSSEIGAFLFKVPQYAYGAIYIECNFLPFFFFTEMCIFHGRIMRSFMFFPQNLLRKFRLNCHYDQPNSRWYDNYYVKLSEDFGLNS